MNAIGRRVWDSIGQDHGTVVEVNSRGRCLVEWDRTPAYQPQFIDIPNEWCSFVASEHSDGTPDA